MRDDCFSTGAFVFYGLLLRTAASFGGVLPKVTLEEGIFALLMGSGFLNFHVCGILSEGQKLSRILYTCRSQTTTRRDSKSTRSLTPSLSSASRVPTNWGPETRLSKNEVFGPEVAEVVREDVGAFEMKGAAESVDG